MAASEHPLWQAGELVLACARSSAGQTTEARSADATVVATSDGAGTISDATGTLLLQAKTAFPKGTSGRLEITGANGAALGTAELRSFKFGPKALKGTIVVIDAAGVEAGRFDPRDGKGQDIAILDAGGGEIGSLRQTGHDRGLRRSTTTYELRIGEGAAPPARVLLVATALRHQALLVAAKNMRAAD